VIRHSELQERAGKPGVGLVPELKLRLFSSHHAATTAGTRLALLMAEPRVQRLSVPHHPVCHMGHVPGPAAGHATAVWICEYPYRTMRLAGPSADCGDCPVWRELEDARARAAALWADAQTDDARISA
jgi:hypothetical protein